MFLKFNEVIVQFPKNLLNDRISIRVVMGQHHLHVDYASHRSTYKHDYRIVLRCDVRGIVTQLEVLPCAVDRTFDPLSKLGWSTHTLPVGLSDYARLMDHPSS
ncbi:hypothetical protein D1Y84_10560 [Acidipila sp. EB88]|nr:hypothetical protein D1Y84_10560 [Acidipila sp. EB88]